MFGIGFKHAHYAELLANPSQHKVVVDRAVDFLEVHSENFFTHELGGGGAARATLAKARQHWPISLHGVGLALGSAVGLDPWHLDQLAELVERTDPLLVSDHACFARGYLPSRSVEAIHASATALHKVGAIPKATLREFDVSCLIQTPDYAPEDVQRIRLANHLSQPVFAMYLNTSESTIQKWEAGSKRPSGMACRLLSVVERHGLRVLA